MEENCQPPLCCSIHVFLVDMLSFFLNKCGYSQHFGSSGHLGDAAHAVRRQVVLFNVIEYICELSQQWLQL